ncbi:putative inorganic phosphate cotransporter [Schistocerca nitens]|uniref:putative inorganic phosphate cotransporter n=1 Tax=Schistocerca nitens TaxID=7011 RepID=UPI0021179B81|nr:putative inorganic phosphate cotransporter [Schistocerca nitens]
MDASAAAAAASAPQPAAATSDRRRRPRLAGCVRQRYVLAVMSFLAIANAYTMRICLSVAITEMVLPHQTPKSYNSNITHSNATDISVQDPDDLRCPGDYPTHEPKRMGTLAEFDWDEETQGLILSSFFWGYILTHLPGGMLAEKFGGKYSLGLGILCTAVFTLLTPLAARYGGATWIIIVRAAEGLGEGPTFPAINALLAHWIPASERGTLGSFVFSGSLIGTVVGNSLSGLLLYLTQSWESVFYVFGGISVLWFIAWQYLCYSSPSSHPFISEEESIFLDKTIGGLEKDKERHPTPWKEMAMSVPLWGLICAQIGHDWGFFTMITDLPKYMSSVLKFSIAQNGFLSSLPYIAMWLVSIGSGRVADWIITHGYLSTTNTRKLFTTIASVGPAVGIIAASYASCDRVTVVSLFTLGMALMGTFYAGMKVNGLDLSPNYAGSVMALVNGIGAITGVIVPYVVGLLTPNSTVLQWRMVFWITVAVLLATNLIFALTASGEIQPWNDHSEEKKPKEKGDNSIGLKIITTQSGNQIS